MAAPQAEITLPPGPIYQDAEIVVNGVDIVKMVSAIKVEAEVGEMARAVITIPYGILLKACADLSLCPETVEVLRSLGWTHEDDTASCHTASASS